MGGAGPRRGSPGDRDSWNVYGGGTPPAAASLVPLARASNSFVALDRSEPTARKPIGEILVGAGVISAETRDRVLEYQEWNHVSFGTALLESGELSERLLLRALSVQFAVPGASAAELESIPPDILALVKRRIVERYSVLPFRKVGRTLHVAMARPNDEPAIRSIGLLTGLTVVPHVAIAVRVAMAIEKHYGVPAAAHYQALARVLGEKPAVAPGGSAAALRETALPTPASEPRPQPPAEPRAAEPVALRPTAPPPWHQLTEALCEAVNPDQVAIVLLDFLKETVGPAALYRVRRDDAVLWRAWPASALARALEIPFSADSLFTASRHTGEVFVGPVPDTPEDRRLLASVGQDFPGNAVVVPVALNERPVLFIVAGAGGGESPLDRPSLGRLAKITATALGLVALHRRLRAL